MSTLNPAVSSPRAVREACSAMGGTLTKPDTCNQTKVVCILLVLMGPPNSMTTIKFKGKREP